MNDKIFERLIICILVVMVAIHASDFILRLIVAHELLK